MIHPFVRGAGGEIEQLKSASNKQILCMRVEGAGIPNGELGIAALHVQVLEKSPVIIREGHCRNFITKGSLYLKPVPDLFLAFAIDLPHAYMFVHILIRATSYCVA